MMGNGTDQDYEALEEIFAFTAQSEHGDYAEYKYLAAIIYSTLAVVGLAINILFCCVIWRTDKLHTVTHMLMTNLAVSNIFFLLFHPPYFLTTFILESNWKFGTLMCKASFSVGYVTVTGSFYFMCLVAIDRWLAIFYRKKRLDRRRCIFLTTGAWILSVIVASPYIYKSRVLDMSIMLDDDPLKAVKTEVTRCGAESMPWDDLALILTIIVQYVVPLVIMIPAYSHLSYFLWQRPTVGVQSKERARKAHARRRRLTITLIAIVAILISCWSPLFSVGILHRFHPEFSFPLYIITSMIALLGVLCTPLCYMANDGFRQQMLQLFPCLQVKERTSDRSTQHFLGIVSEVAVSVPNKGAATVASCNTTFSSAVLHKKDQEERLSGLLTMYMQQLLLCHIEPVVPKFLKLIGSEAEEVVRPSVAFVIDVANKKREYVKRERERVQKPRRRRKCARFSTYIDAANKKLGHRCTDLIDATIQGF